MGERFPYAHLVPKGYVENLRFRKALVEAGSRDLQVAQDIWVACARDPLFYINTFVWTYNPKKKHGETLPFITYPYQEDMIREIVAAIEDGEDFVMEKSRDMGASWICMLVFEWYWHFHGGKQFLCVSSKEDLVDKSNNKNSLFWKVDFVLRSDHQPGWLRPSYDHYKLMFVNYDNGSTITGESTNSNAGRGGRSTAILLDEFAAVEEDTKVAAATRDNTDCRIFNSTPTFRGTNCEFYKQTQKEGVRKYRAHWTLHPEKSQGLYYDHNGKPRSAWYDKQCNRASSPAEIAIELDIDYQGAAAGVFSVQLIDKLKKQTTPPLIVAIPSYDLDKKEFLLTHSDKGWLRLWQEPLVRDGVETWPSEDEFVVGADVSYGKGSTNSTMSVANRKTGVKVCEIVNAHIEPHEWGKLAVAVARWFNGAFLIWEENGPGTIFRENVVKCGYRNFFYRQNEKKLNKPDSDVPGWYATPQTKQTLISAYQKALAEDKFVNYSYDALHECLQYVFTKAGGVEHGGAINPADPSGAKQNHGDRVIADALAWRGCCERPVREKEAPKEEVPYLSFGWRQEQRRRTGLRDKVWVPVGKTVYA